MSTNQNIKLLRSINLSINNALKAKQIGDKKIMMDEFFEGINSINVLIQELVSLKSLKLRDTLHAREQFCQHIIDNDDNLTFVEYFTEFAIAVRTRHLI